MQKARWIMSGLFFDIFTLARHARHSSHTGSISFLVLYAERGSVRIVGHSSASGAARPVINVRRVTPARSNSLGAYCPVVLVTKLESF